METANILLLGFVSLMVAAVGGSAIYFLTWLTCGRNEYSPEKTVTAKVLATTFHPEETHTRFGPVVGGNGGMAFTTAHEDEEDIVLLHAPETGRITIDNANLLDNAVQGEDVRLTYKEKYFFWFWNPENKVFVEHVPITVVVKDGTQISI